MEKKEKEKSMLKISIFILQTLIRVVQISSVIGFLLVSISGFIPFCPGEPVNTKEVPESMSQDH
jgi:hypothetical protein